MKTFTIFPQRLLFALFAPLIAATAFMTLSTPASAEAVYLGQSRLAASSADLDFIRVPGCEKRIDRIQLRAKHADAYIRAAVVRFANGDTQNLDFQGRLRHGEGTRWAELDGRLDRCITTIAVLGDTRYNQDYRQSMIEIWGNSSGSWSNSGSPGNSGYPNNPWNNSGSSGNPGSSGGWWNANTPRSLGSTKLSIFGDDRDVVRIQECGLRRIQLRALNASADIQAIRVNFKNGERSNLGYRTYLRQGKQTPWIDLPGSDRCVTSIAITGSTNFNFSFSSARIEILGR